MRTAGRSDAVSYTDHTFLFCLADLGQTGEAKDFLHTKSNRRGGPGTAPGFPVPATPEQTHRRGVETGQIPSPRILFLSSPSPQLSATMFRGCRCLSLLRDTPLPGVHGLIDRAKEQAARETQRGLFLHQSLSHHKHSRPSSAHWLHFRPAIAVLQEVLLGQREREPVWTRPGEGGFGGHLMAGVTASSMSLPHPPNPITHKGFSAKFCPIFPLSASIDCVSTTVGERECSCFSAKICRFWRPIYTVSDNVIVESLSTLFETATLMLVKRQNPDSSAHLVME